MLTSSSNPRVQAARRLRRRAGRDEAGAFLAEGPIAVLDALRSGLEVREIFAAPGSDPAVGDEAASRGIDVVEAGPRVLAALSETVTPQGIVAVVGRRIASRDEIATSDLVVILDQVRDPGNAGTLLRSALAAGAGGVVFTRGSVDPWNPKTLRAAAGAAFRLPIAVELELHETVSSLRARGSRVLAADAHADRPYHQTDLARPFALVLGNEAWGLPGAHLDVVDETIGIPMPGPVESLNVAIAGSLILFEAVRQRSSEPPVYPLRSDV